MRAFERLAGKRMSLVTLGLAWRACDRPCDWVAFPADDFDAIRAHGSIPEVDWASYSYPFTLDQPDFSLGAIAAGHDDAFLRRFAAAAAAWRHRSSCASTGR